MLTITPRVAQTPQSQCLFQYGVVTGDCPDDEGFNLNRYSNYTAVREHLLRYDRNNLPALVRKTATEKFTVTSGARDDAAKAAVIFLGEGKVRE